MHMKPRLQKGLVMHKETRHYMDYTSSSMDSQPSISDSCIGQILKFAIDVAEISPSFVSSNLTSKAAHKLFTIFFCQLFATHHLQLTCLCSVLQCQQ